MNPEKPMHHARVHAIAILSVLLLASIAAARGIPLNVELDGCVLPAPACPSTRDVITLNEDKRTLSFSVDEIRVPGARATPLDVLDALRIRPARVYGPDELKHKLVAGAHVRIRAVFRRAERYLLLSSVEPLPEKGK